MLFVPAWLSNRSRPCFQFAIAFLGLAFSAPAAHAAMELGAPTPLPGTTDYDHWPTSNIIAPSNPGFPGFPGSGDWPNPIQSQLGGDATLNKVANGAGGGPFPATGSIYYGSFSGDPNADGGKLRVSDATPVSGVQNVLFQLQIGEAATHDLYNDVLPVLSYNSGTQGLAPTNAKVIEKFFNGTVETPTGPEPLYINTYLLQWDLTGLGAISNFNVDWNGVPHAQVYTLRLDQSTSYAPVAVPEPGVLGMVGSAALLLLRRRRDAIVA